VTGTKIFLTTSEVIGEIPALRLALVAAASSTASDLATSCAAAHATASCRLLDLGVDLTMDEPSLGLSFLLLPFLPMVVVGTLLGLRVLWGVVLGEMGPESWDSGRARSYRGFHSMRNDAEVEG
jgi:hypothetical protein